MSGRQVSRVPNTDTFRFRHTFATWAIENKARGVDVRNLRGHSTPDMVWRYSATYNSDNAARSHVAFGSADRLGDLLAEGALAIPLA